MKSFYVFIIITLTVLSCKTANQQNLPAYYASKPDLTNIAYNGGDGKSMERAIIISNAKNSRDGIAAEYAYIEKFYGIKNVDWQVKSQSLDRINEKRYDIITFLILPENDEVTLYFDITEFYGKL